MSQADDKCQGPSLRVQMLTGLLALWRMDSSLVGAQGHSCWAGWILGTVFVSKHTLSLLCPTLSAWPQCHPLCLTCFPLNPPGIPPASPAPGLILTTRAGNV